MDLSDFAFHIMQLIHPASIHQTAVSESEQWLHLQGTLKKHTKEEQQEATTSRKQPPLLRTY